jgi:GLPGLI family protein
MTHKKNRKQVWLVLLALAMQSIAVAQVVTAAKIEFEVTTNVHKTMGDDSWSEKMKEAIPQFSVHYYDFIFANNKSVYKYNRKDERYKFPNWMENDGREENVWYTDFTTSQHISQHLVAGDQFLMSDSLHKIKWRLSNESRVIAGFNCRKAVGRIFDSVYIFAFYTDDIMITGGPMSVNGLPGMILGLTIPRMYTSYIATKVQVVDVPEKSIVPPGKGKYKTKSEINAFIQKRTADWGKYRDKFIWSMML